MAEPTSWAIVATAPWAAADGTVQPIGTCTEKIWWDGVTPWTPPAGTEAVADTGQPVYQTIAPVPQTVQMWQAKYVLSQQPAMAGSTNANLLLDANAAVAAAGGPLAAYWGDAATTLTRAAPGVAAIATALGLTNAQVDALFVAAAAVAI